MLGFVLYGRLVLLPLLMQNLLGFLGGCRWPLELAAWRRDGDCQAADRLHAREARGRSHSLTVGLISRAPRFSAART